MSDYIPHELLLEILLRLPVKPLLKCRCVSKTWHSMISDPTFITTHLNRTLTKTTHNNPNTVLFRAQNFGISGDNFTLRIDDTDETFASHSTQLNCPHKSIANVFLRIVGYCNGVLCLSDDFIGYSGGYALWNPSINKSVSIPDPNSYMSHDPIVHSLGFGFDAVNNDYKLVRLLYLKGEDFEFDFEFEVVPPLVDIYSLRSGSWRDVTAPALNYVTIKDPAFVNGACHWVAHTPQKKDKFRNVIVSFDLGNEIFSEMDMPESLVGDNSLNMAVTVLGGSLALVSSKWGQGRCSVWMMKEYGVAESWTELFGIGIPNIDGSEGLWVVAFRKNGEVVVTTGEKLFSFDPMNQKFKSFFDIQGVSFSIYMDTYVESLVLLNEANRDEGNARIAGASSNVGT